MRIINPKRINQSTGICGLEVFGRASYHVGVSKMIFLILLIPTIRCVYYSLGYKYILILLMLWPELGQAWPGSKYYLSVIIKSLSTCRKTCR